MERWKNFTFRVTEQERKLITEIAAKLDRNDSDAVRYLIRQKARELGIIHPTEQVQSDQEPMTRKEA